MWSYVAIIYISAEFLRELARKKIPENCFYKTENQLSVRLVLSILNRPEYQHFIYTEMKYQMMQQIYILTFLF